MTNLHFSLGSTLSYTISFMFPCDVIVLPFSTVQERLTKQIAEAISEALEPAGVAVVIEAR